MISEKLHNTPLRDGGYDYIIAGAGCAGLSLTMHMIQSGKFSDKRILIIDKSEKRNNDRTWCFWEKDAGLFESVVCKKWEQAWIHSEDYSKLMNIFPYQYKMIRGIDFYKFSFDSIKRNSNFEVIYGDIEKFESNSLESFVLVNGKKITAQYIFNSILFQKPELKKNEVYLLQHFKGWMIESSKPVFNPQQAILMDFRVDQKRGTTFIYVMPFSETKALVEYTLFTPSLLDPHQYDEGIKKYIHKVLKIENYSILEEEIGIIPMTNHKFLANNNNIINIGTAGGQTKASSGYTFRFIQKNSAAIVQQLIINENPFVSKTKRRFHFYDSVLLTILDQQLLPGKKVFTELFKKNKPQTVLRFLDNESSISEELKVISSLPTLPFLKAALHQL